MRLVGMALLMTVAVDVSLEYGVLLMLLLLLLVLEEWFVSPVGRHVVAVHARTEHAKAGRLGMEQ
jgi:ABC-type branched-subunit amino acid transport system permease subunit